LQKGQFSNKPNAKLSPRVYGLLRVTQKINDNANKIELPGAYGVSATFNLDDLSPYFGDEEYFRLEDESSPTQEE